MAIKDFSGAENADRKSKTSTEKENLHSGATEKTEVKNAHATGDGSFGRSDESVPDETTTEEINDNTY